MLIVVMISCRQLFKEIVHIGLACKMPRNHHYARDIFPRLSFFFFFFYLEKPLQQQIIVAAVAKVELN